MSCVPWPSLMVAQEGLMWWSLLCTYPQLLLTTDRHQSCCFLGLNSSIALLLLPNPGILCVSQTTFTAPSWLLTLTVVRLACLLVLILRLDLILPFVPSYVCGPLARQNGILTQWIKLMGVGLFIV